MNISDKQYKEFVVYVKNNIGIDLGSNKKALVTSRIRKLCLRNKINTFDELFKAILVDKDEKITTLLTDAITTNYTYFMREAEHFEYLENVVLPNIKKNNRSKDLRIWCAASSTGEEPYTLAMIIDSVLGEEKNEWDRKLLATDISTKVLSACEEGIYSNEAISVLPAEWRNKYFKRIDKEHSKVVDSIKNQILFRKFNLMEPEYPFKKKFNVIFCRNVMIYFDSETRNRLINKFYDLLEPGGYLFIGHSETVEKTKSKFIYIAPSIYRKGV